MYMYFEPLKYCDHKQGGKVIDRHYKDKEVYCTLIIFVWVKKT